MDTDTHASFSGKATAKAQLLITKLYLVTSIDDGSDDAIAKVNEALDQIPADADLSIGPFKSSQVLPLTRRFSGLVETHMHDKDHGRLLSGGSSAQRDSSRQTMQIQETLLLFIESSRSATTKRNGHPRL
jgi:hypothetical protein